MPAIEISAHDIESAINKGLSQLQLLRAEVKIEVLDEGSRGVLGIGARPARVRLTPYAEIEAAAEAGSVAVEAPASEDSAMATLDAALENAQLPATKAAPSRDPSSQNDSVEADQLLAPEREHALTDDDARLAAELTQGVLDRMHFKTTCTGRLVQPADERESACIWVSIEGEDASRLLAHQAESLEALQLVVQNMWAHKTKSSARITLDADRYKANREQRLKQMATRLAERVVSAGRSITLEPMPPAERRLIHLALRDHPQVYTESEGEGSQRRVTIKLKK
ncbi:MAG: RNA-binding cell elongation regulator Jag/EloR [Anaerolineae bacterium]